MYFIGLNDWIVKIEEGRTVSFAPDTTDVLLRTEYEAWLAEGNVPERMIPLDALPPWVSDES